MQLSGYQLIGKLLFGKKLLQYPHFRVLVLAHALSKEGGQFFC